MAQIVKSELVAMGSTFDGRQVSVVQHSHDEDIRGVGRDTVSVNVSGNATVPPSVFGFVNADEAMRFLTTPGAVQVQSVDNSGNLTQIERTGLGVPSGMIARFRDEAPEPAKSTRNTPSSDSTTENESNDDNKTAE